MTLTDAEVQELIDLRRHFHRRPELGFQERATAETIAARLREYGYAVQTGVGGTGVVGLLNGDKDGPTVLLRADIDALPIEEENDVEYRSIHPGIMHACGHDGHIAIALGVAKRLTKVRSTLPGRVKFAFQPAEELLSGAMKMVEDGVLERPPVDAAFGLHLWNNLDVGMIGVVAGPMMASVDRFQIVIQGRGGHGAMPHQTVDAIVVASHVVAALQTVVSRNTDPLDAVVVTVGTIQGGHAFNVIAEQTTLTGTVRTFDATTYETIPNMIERVVAGVCHSLGAQYTMRYDRLCQPTVNDPEMTRLVRQAASEIVGSENVVQTQEARTMGGEDMSVFLQRVPGCYFFVGSRNRARGFHHPHHSPRFDFDEAALPIGVEILERITMNYLMRAAS
ncbi:MAG: amidohydrolase [Acidobacteria bacterium]|nr:MAG: amidohydrolase [Acidobacteriota bacterium]